MQKLLRLDASCQFSHAHNDMMDRWHHADGVEDAADREIQRHVG